MSSLIALAGSLAVWASNYGTPEMANLRASTLRARLLREAATYLLISVPMVVALVVVLGLFPDVRLAE